MTIVVSPCNAAFTPVWSLGHTRGRRYAHRMGAFGRLRARMRGDVSAEPLRAYRRAGGTVDALLAEVERRRVDAGLAGRGAWSTDRSAQQQALCAWCAFVLQQLGDATLGAQEARRAGGFVSERVHAQVAVYYREVQEWVRRGHEAGSSHAYRIDTDLPARLPAAPGAWRERPPVLLEGLRRATESVGARAESSARALLAEATPSEHAPAAEAVGQLLARARAAAQYAEQLWSADPDASLRPELERGVLAALSAYHQLGQLVALPELALSPRPGAQNR